MTAQDIDEKSLVEDERAVEIQREAVAQATVFLAQAKIARVKLAATELAELLSRNNVKLVGRPEYRAHRDGGFALHVGFELVAE